MPNPRLPDHIAKALDDTGLPYTIKVKKRHRFIFLLDKLALTIPKCGSKDGFNSRHVQNNLAVIRKVAREIKGNQQSPI